MKILLTGGSGAVGTPLLKMLSAQANYEVRLFDLPSKRAQKTYRPYASKFEIIYGNLTKQSEVQAACQDVDLVIHLAAVIPPLADEKPQLAENVNVKGTENLLRALEQHSPQAFFLYASSVSVYGDRLADPHIRVDDPMAPSFADEYAKTKIEAERLIKSSQLDWSIFRLSAIFGFGNHKVTGLMFHMPLATPIEFTTPEDTARAFFHAIEQRQALKHQIFNLGGGEKCRISYEDFLSRSFAIAGLGKLNFPREAFADKNFHCAYYADGDDLENILGFRKDSVTTYFEKLKASTSPLQRFFTQAFNKPIKRYLLKKSEPYEALHENDQAGIARFFV